MTVVRLLGPPHVVGAAAPPGRGRKPWALLALLLCSTGPVPRSRATVMAPLSSAPRAAVRSERR
jgi:hypothetical protein